MTSDARDLLADTRPEPRGDGVYAVQLPAGWDFLMPSGGVLATASLRAAAAELADDGLRLVSATTVFCTPLAPGELTARVAVLRRGGNAAQVRIGLSGGPDAGLETLATFARDRPGPDVRGAHFPDVPLPDDAADLAIVARPDRPGAQLTFFRNFDMRLARGPRFWEPGWEAGPARHARWFRYKVPPRDAAGRLERLALPPIVDMMPPALTSAIGPGYRFYAPSLDLTLHVLDDTDREWLLINTYARRARAGYATAEVEVWDDTRRLVAYGTQTMYLKTIVGEPPGGIVAPA